MHIKQQPPKTMLPLRENPARYNKPPSIHHNSSKIVTIPKARSNPSTKELNSKSATKTSQTLKGFSDKISILFNESLPLEKIVGFIDKKIGSIKRRYPYTPSRSFRYVFENGIVLFIYRNDYQTEVQSNLTHFDSLEGLITFIELITGRSIKEGRITRLHVHVDVPIPIDEMISKLKVPRVSNSHNFKPVDKQTFKKGRLKEVSFNHAFGSEKRKTLKIYDSGIKHDLPGDYSRAEKQYQARSVCPIETLDQLETVSFDPFKEIVFKSLKLPPNDLSKRDRERYELLKLQIEKRGFHNGLATIRSNDPKHFDRNYKRIKNLIKTKSVNFNSIWRKKAQAFVNAPVSDREADLLISILEVGEE